MSEDAVEARIRELERTITRLESMVDTGDQLIKAEIRTMKAELAALKDDLTERVHVTRYVIVERIVFGLVALTLTSVFAAVIALVVGSGGGSGVVP